MARPKSLNGGRPTKLKPTEETLKTCEGLGRIQATGRECAALLGVTEVTYLKFKKDNHVVAEAYAKGSGTGLASLRRRQFAVAESGNPTMLIWLGKQFLDQSDKNEFTGKDGKDLSLPVINFIQK